ncbi:UPF0149 family protein, partial [Klebsiella pneumoniae]|uniref:UPF0149 family protein n=1 Tax=Klebsiella pneumoniae TaxID=573 RepID=UPI00292CC291
RRRDTLDAGDKFIRRQIIQRAKLFFAAVERDSVQLRLESYPDQFEPLFGTREAEGQELTIVEEWCFGYLRGVALSDWSTLPAELQPELDAIALHGSEEQFSALDNLTADEFIASIERITPAALALYQYWIANPQPVEAPQPIRNEAKVGRNDPCPCGSGKKYKQCCLAK